jgi:hypothetical protein
VFVAVWLAAALVTGELLWIVLRSFGLLDFSRLGAMPIAVVLGWAAGGAVGRAALDLRVRAHRTTRRPGARYLLRLALAAFPAVVFSVGLLVLIGTWSRRVLGLWFLPPASLGALLALIVAVITLAAGRPPKRSWYDKVSGTWVVDLRAPKRQAQQVEFEARRAQAIAAQMRLAGQYAGPHGPAGTVVVHAQPRTNPLAVFSLVWGIIGGSALAIIFGHIARSQIRRTGANGAGMALAGLILGYFWLALSIAAALSIFTADLY